MTTEEIFLENMGMLGWVDDVPKNMYQKKIFESIIEYASKKNENKNVIKVLEVGSYTGISLINIVKRIPKSIGVAIDAWENYDELNLDLFKNMSNIEKVFHENVKKSKLPIITMKGDSIEKLTELIKSGEKFDFIYIDGSHLLLDCYADLILSWQILNSGGIMAIDDYPYLKNLDILKSPYEAVNRFLEKFKNECKVLSKTYRVFVEKC